MIEMETARKQERAKDRERERGGGEGKADRDRQGATMFQNLFSLMRMQMLLEPLCKCYS